MPKPDLADKKSAFASCFNAATALTAGEPSDLTPEELAEQVIDLTVALYEARIAAQEEMKIGGQKEKAAGRGGSGGRSGGSRRSSGRPRSNDDGNASKGQIDYASDIMDRLDDAGEDSPISLKKFKKLSYDDASSQLEELIEIDPKNN